MKYFSPAKLNLFFRVLHKRADGYHEIASLFQAIDLGDDLIVEPSDRDIFTCNDDQLNHESNLVWKAWKLFQKHYPCPPVHIHLEKRIPMQAGLGGGSSNAATALWALNMEAGKPAKIEKLQTLGAQIGSDVPFFFSLGTAYCTGRGEILEPVAIPPLSGYLAKPTFGLSTPLVYRETRVEELDPIDPKAAFSSFLTSKPLYFNDLEKAAFRLEPRLIAFKEQLLSQFQTVLMTGSGTSFFCIHRSRSSETGKQLRSGFGIDLECETSFHSISRFENSWY